jgi:hypothetical protein
MKAPALTDELLCKLTFTSSSLTDWLSLKQLLTASLDQTALRAIHLPPWLGPGLMVLGVFLILIGSSVSPKKY